MGYKDKRFFLIYSALSSELCREFIDEYELKPDYIGPDRYPEFYEKMQEFLEVHRNEPSIQLACIHYPEPPDDPDLEKLLENDKLLSVAPELIRCFNAKNLEKRVSDLEQRMREPVAEWAPEPGYELLKTSIYQKMFLPPIPKNRYRQLDEDEKAWIKKIICYSDTERFWFNSCCFYDTLYAAAESAGISESQMKRFSSLLTNRIRHVVQPDDTEADCISES